MAINRPCDPRWTLFLSIAVDSFIDYFLRFLFPPRLVLARCVLKANHVRSPSFYRPKVRLFSRFKDPINFSLAKKNKSLFTTIKERTTGGN